MEQRKIVGTGITGWLDRKADEAEGWLEKNIGGRISSDALSQKKAIAAENAFDNPTLRAYMKMIGAKGIRFDEKGNYEAYIKGKWTKVPNPKAYFKSQQKEIKMPEDKGKPAGKPAAGPVNRKGGPMFAEDDSPIPGMNPSSAPMRGSGPPDLGIPARGEMKPVGPQPGDTALSGAKWAEPILQAIPGNRSDLMNKAMKLIGQLGEVLAEAGYTEGGAPPGVEGGQPPVPSPQPPGGGVTGEGIGGIPGLQKAAGGKP